MKKTDKSKHEIDPNLVLPFGYGTRMCIARRFAEQTLLLLMIRVSFKKQKSWTREKF